MSSYAVLLAEVNSLITRNGGTPVYMKPNFVDLANALDQLSGITPYRQSSQPRILK